MPPQNFLLTHYPDPILPADPESLILKAMLVIYSFRTASDNTLRCLVCFNGPFHHFKEWEIRYGHTRTSKHTKSVFRCAVPLPVLKSDYAVLTSCILDSRCVPTAGLLATIKQKCLILNGFFLYHLGWGLLVIEVVLLMSENCFRGIWDELQVHWGRGLCWGHQGFCQAKSGNHLCQTAGVFSCRSTCLCTYLLLCLGLESH